ncbi:MAG: hypothetical protein IAF58_08270 [Leptolyngbya sp.]|nr:hypothetical protein [Candidatus Melainabacteria bacterium]
MSKRPLNNALTLVATSIALFATNCPVFAEIAGKVEEQSLTGRTVEQILRGNVEQRTLPSETGVSSGVRLLNGSIKDDAALNASLRLLPSGVEKNGGLNGGVNGQGIGGKVDQFAGNTPYLPGQAVPASRPNSPLNPVGGWTTHQIPPISSYVLTPRNGVMTWAPGFSVTPGATTTVYTQIPPQFSGSHAQTREGVTSFSPGYNVQHLASSAHGNISGRGVMTFGAGYGVEPINGPKSLPIPSPISKEGVTAYAPGYEVKKVVETRSSISSYTPGGNLSHTTSRDGVVCWSPGYEVSIMVPGFNKQTLGGQWTAPTNPALRATEGKLHVGGGEFAEPVIAAQEPQALQATAMLMPQLRAVAATSWNDWYSRVAGAIYSRWQNVEVGPGNATVRVTVTKNRDVSCQVEEFTPADGVDRNVASETMFRESALNAVNLVQQYEIPKFPANADLPRVTFDLVMKRNVDTPAGFDVAGVNKKESVLQKEAKKK